MKGGKDFRYKQTAEVKVKDGKGRGGGHCD